MVDERRSKSGINGWTVETLRTYVLDLMDEHDKRYEQRFLAQETAVTQALAAAKEAVAVAESNSDKWRTNANEWRGAMDDRERNFVSKETHQKSEDTLVKSTKDLKERLDKNEGKGAGLNAMWGYLIGAAGLGVLLISIIEHLK